MIDKEKNQKISKGTEEYIEGYYVWKDTGNKCFKSDWRKYKSPYWLQAANIPAALFDTIGIKLDVARSKEFDDACDGNFDAYYNLAVLAENNYPEETLKWLMGPFKELLNNKNMSLNEGIKQIDKRNFRNFIRMLSDNTIHRIFAKDIFFEMIENKADVETISSDKKYQLADQNDIEHIIDKIINDNPEQVSKAKENEKIIMWFVGQIMKESKGKANPQELQSLLKQKLV